MCSDADASMIPPVEVHWTVEGSSSDDTLKIRIVDLTSEIIVVSSAKTLNVFP